MWIMKRLSSIQLVFMLHCYIVLKGIADRKNLTTRCNEENTIYQYANSSNNTDNFLVMITTPFMLSSDGQVELL